MANSKFSLDGLEDSTRQIIPPHYVMPLWEEEEVLEAGVDTQLFQTRPGLPVPQEEQAEQTNDASENSVLQCIMEDAPNQLHVFQEYEHYSLGVNSESDCDVPEEELADEMEDQLDPLDMHEKEDPTEGDHGQRSPRNIPVDDLTAIEENETNLVNLHATLVNVQGTDPQDPSTPRPLDFNNVFPEANQEVTIPEIESDVNV